MNLSDSAKRYLLKLARYSIASAITPSAPNTFTKSAPANDSDPVLDARNLYPLPKDTACLETKAATFVTLHLNGQLRGCIGCLESFETLEQNVSHNARSAAFKDPRFAPVTEAELDQINIEISILTPMQAIQFDTEAALFSQIETNRHGICIQHGFRKATFLPQVWQSLPDKQEFFRQLKIKAGIDQGLPVEELQCWRYEVICFSEGEAKEGI